MGYYDDFEVSDMYGENWSLEEERDFYHDKFYQAREIAQRLATQLHKVLYQKGGVSKIVFTDEDGQVYDKIGFDRFVACKLLNEVMPKIGLQETRG